MSVKSLMFLTSALASAGLVIEPVAAAAIAGMSGRAVSGMAAQLHGAVGVDLAAAGDAGMTGMAAGEAAEARAPDAARTPKHQHC